jgi:CTP:molybdopterin cytidylyltransferase MocA
MARSLEIDFHTGKRSGPDEVKAAGIILAAGESRRMGRPKALLEYRGETFVDRLVRALSGFCDPVIVVTGAHDREIRGGMRETARLVWNPQYALGQLTSLQAGLRAVPDDRARILLTLVDHPLVQASTVARLLESAAPFAVATYQGKRGHPIVFDGSFRPEFLALDASGSARDIRERHAAQVAYIEADDPGIVADIDDPQAYERILQDVAS